MGAALPKVFLRLADGVSEPSLIQRTVNLFQQDETCERIVVCINPEWRSRFEDELRGHSKVVLAEGGASRQDSVRCGVEVLRQIVSPSEPAKRCVLIHDAARCCLPHQVVRRVVEGVYKHNAVTAAIPVPDSLGTVSDGVVNSFVDRRNVWAIQTPQGFWLDDLQAAHDTAKNDGFVALDDASVVARIREVRVIEGDRRNIKVTHPQDLMIALRMCDEA